MVSVDISVSGVCGFFLPLVFGGNGDLNIHHLIIFYRCAVHSDICRGHSPTNALLLI